MRSSDVCGIKVFLTNRCIFFNLSLLAPPKTFISQMYYTSTGRNCIMYIYIDTYKYISALGVPAGMVLSMGSAAAVYDDVAIKVRPLQSSGRNFSCKLSTGDGRVIYPDRPEA